MTTMTRSALSRGLEEFAESYMFGAMDMGIGVLAYKTLRRIHHERAACEQSGFSVAGRALGTINGISLTFAAFGYAALKAPDETAAAIVVTQLLSYLYERRRHEA